jgi:hypothetical protein
MDTLKVKGRDNVAVEGESFGNKNRHLFFSLNFQLPVRVLKYEIARTGNSTKCELGFHHLPRQLNKVRSFRVDEKRGEQVRLQEDAVSSSVFFLKVRALPQ